MEQTKQTLAQTLGDQTDLSTVSGLDRNLGMGQTEETESLVWATRKRPKIWHGPYPADHKLDMSQTGETKNLVWARSNRRQIGNGPD